ncbi:TetR/AcrR family transcriptional regulator [Paractinoplanes ferrugineus]|uniref:TetR family transcriptional regulator n=1 Tax=Paractinoplanes ferrugineus TaxID=113564 RepID=A0A919J1L7_9ACTN|nr:TetR/AcrR family transcriptional regulator [Actinoplanes ferrugineus]GIE13091.1 TetR family transcriptional regulator [Actinoplanes ferrugineus]
MTQTRAVRTRALILTSAAEEFAAHGYNGATLLGVVERTGMTKGALYGHFSSKDELAAVLIEEGGDDLIARAEQSVEGLPALEALREAVLRIARQLRRDVSARSALRLTGEAPHLDRREPGLIMRLSVVLTRAVARTQQENHVLRAHSPRAVAQLLMSVFFEIPYPAPADDADVARRFDDLWSAVSESHTGNRGSA